MKNRAYVALNIKAVDADAREIEGWATLAEMDRVGDIVLPRGAVYSLPIPFLLDHDTKQAVGEVYRVEVTDKGIKFWASIKKIAEPGEVKDLCDKAWTLVKNGLRKCVSIGFSALDFDRLPTGGLKFTSWEWLELSAVTVPAMPGAQITNIKDLSRGDRLSTASPPDSSPSLDTVARAASGPGRLGVVRLTPPASGLPTSPSKEGKEMKISEKIRRFEEKRAANSARIGAIHEETDESLNDAQMDEVKTLEAEIATIDRDLPSLKRAEASLAATAKNVRTVETDPNAPPAPTPGVSVKAPPKLAPGIAFTQLVKVKMAAKLTGDPTLVMARRMYGVDSEVAAIITKANEVVAGTTLSGNWAYDLVSQEGAAAAAFLEYLRPATIVGKFGQVNIPSLSPLDFYMPYVTQTGGGDAYWVGEGKPKPLTAFDFDRSTLTPLKIANIAVLTEENIRYSSPKSDVIVRDALAKAIIAGIDVAFVDPANNGSANVKPASITYQAETVVSTGDAADDIRLDVRALFAHFIAANNAPTQGVWIMSATNALALGMMVNALGQTEFPGIGMMGGTFQGLPVIVSEHIGNVVVLVAADQIFLGDEGGISVDMSREASLEMRSTGLGMDGTAGTATAASVSMFQTNMVALRAERAISWKRARTSAVAYLTSVDWGGAVPPS